MWLFTESGFVSAVAHGQDSGFVVARSRDQRSLTGLAASSHVSIETTRQRDYPYRAHVSRGQFQTWVASVIDTMGYTNFKNRIHETRGDQFYESLSAVWEIMHDVTDCS